MSYSPPVQLHGSTENGLQRRLTGFNNEPRFFASSSLQESTFARLSTRPQSAHRSNPSSSTSAPLWVQWANHLFSTCTYHLYHLPALCNFLHYTFRIVMLMDLTLDIKYLQNTRLGTQTHMTAHGHITTVGLTAFTTAIAICPCLRHGYLMDATHDDCEGGWLMLICCLLVLCLGHGVIVLPPFRFF